MPSLAVVLVVAADPELEPVALVTALWHAVEDNSGAESIAGLGAAF